MTGYKDFFRQLTGNDPLPYQERYAGAPFEHTIMAVPTGLGKTACVVAPFLYRAAAGETRPTRMAFVLPRQNLTRQTADTVKKYIKSAGLSIRVLELMGGSDDNDAKLGPDEDAVLIGTQDILVSRALNRGYARRPFHWPIDFGLLNNDCIWVFDEVQLMSDALATSAQLAAFRERFGVFGAVPTVWMSATLRPEWFDTVDFAPRRAGVRTIAIEEDDRRVELVQKRLGAAKSLALAPESCRTAEGCAEFALSQHSAGKSLAVIVNTVQRAVDISKAITKHGGETLVVHSRFRPRDKAARTEELLEAARNGGIVISTQVIEAGIDVSFDAMITDVAPWGSLVQRFGRVNRYGERDGAAIWVVDRPVRNEKLARGELTEKDLQSVYAPYAAAECEAALLKVKNRDSAAPGTLPEEDGAAPWRNVLRRSDLLDLFDTSPDLGGNEIDVSRFVRSAEDRDCYVGWRDWAGDGPLPDIPRLTDEELCPVPIGELRDFAAKRKLYRWDFVSGEWEAANRDLFHAGLILMARAADGGYTKDFGWDRSSTKAVPPLDCSTEPEDAVDDDAKSYVTYRQTLSEHTAMVVQEMRTLMARLEQLQVGRYRGELETAAFLHDWGKAHSVFQEAMHHKDNSEDYLAKQHRASAGHYRFRHFRHELASALAMIAAGHSDLAAYLAAAHHGRLRVVLRSMPGERGPDGRVMIRGIQSDDPLPGVDLDGLVTQGQFLTLDLVQLGQAEDGSPSWTERAVKLRDEIGPFRLAYLEMMLRAADTRASEKAERRAGSWA